jgi:hypothetical protein
VTIKGRRENINRRRTWKAKNGTRSQNFSQTLVGKCGLNFSYLGGKRKLPFTKSCFDGEELEEITWEKKNSDRSNKESL